MLLHHNLRHPLLLLSRQCPAQCPRIAPAAIVALLQQQRRRLATAAPNPAVPPKPTALPKRPAPPSAPIEHEDRDMRPSTLARPIGVQAPPQPGENSGVDTRSLSQRRDDFVNYDKHLAKRHRLASEMSRPYFRDFTRMSKEFKGKGWIAPPSVFKAEAALFFPNLMGRTLAKGMPERANTTLALYGNTSVVAVYSSAWAEKQVGSWLKDTPLPEGTQTIEINVEQNWFKALLVRMFMGSLRKVRAEEDWEKYFLVTKGLTRELRYNMGLWNSRVGYVYLVDRACRIRWAGSGVAEPQEKKIMLKALDKLVAEQRKEEEEEREAERVESERREARRAAKASG